jgi:hypothetical protein
MEIKNEIKALCRKANPKRDWYDQNYGIAEILVAFHKTDHAFGLAIYTDGEVVSEDQLAGDEKIYWDLKNDDIDMQSQDTLKGLINLLKT